MIACTIDHVHLRALDPVTMAQFFVDVFGGVDKGQVYNGDKLRKIVNLAGLTLFIEEVPATTPAPPKPPFLGYEHIGLTVKDIAAAMADVKKRGIPVVMDINKLSDSLTIAFIDGPENIRIELLQRS